MISLDTFLFTVFALLTVGSAVMVVLTRQIVRAACFLLLSLAGAAGLFFSLGATFLGTLQLMIYVGGTLVLVLFGLMLTANDPTQDRIAGRGTWYGAIVIGTAFLTLMLHLFWYQWPTPEPSGHPTSVSPLALGLALLGFRESLAGQPTTNYVFPFEIISVHLVVVLIGSAYLARSKRRPASSQAPVERLDKVLPHDDSLEADVPFLAEVES